MKQFLMLAIASILIGCQSSPSINTQDSFKAQHATAKVKKGTFDYEKMLAETSLNKLLEIEQHGIYERPDKAGNVDFIRLRMKLTGFDKQADTKIAEEEELLDSFLYGITALLAEKTAVDKQNIELIMQAVDCQIHALAGSLRDVKCDKAPVKSTSQDNSYYIKTKYSIQQYKICLDSGANHAFCLNYATNLRDRTISDGTSFLTEDKLKQFCEKGLAKAFAKHDFQPVCEVIHNETERYFVIKNIQVRSYITDGYWEKFSIKLGYQYGKNADNEFYGDLKIEGGGCVARIFVRKDRPGPELFKDKLSDCDAGSDKKIIRKESDLADLFNRYFEAKKKT